MNISKPVTQLQLFHTKRVNEKVYFEVMWKKRKEIFSGLKFTGAKEEIRTSGRFANIDAAKGFVITLKHIPSFSGWYEIIEYK